MCASAFEGSNKKEEGAANSQIRGAAVALLVANVAAAERVCRGEAPGWVDGEDAPEEVVEVPVAAAVLRERGRAAHVVPGPAARGRLALIFFT